MEERLERVLNRVIDWLKYEEAKNGALITLNGVGMAVIVQWVSNATPTAASPLLKGSVAALLLSIMIGLFSFYPVLDSEKLLKNLVRLRKRTVSNANVLFFADIAGSDPQTYLNHLRTAVRASSGDVTQLESDYACEIVANAKIAVFKLRLFKAAFVVSVLAFTIAVVAAIVHLVSG